MIRSSLNGNSNGEESLRSTLCPVYAAASSAESPSGPSLAVPNVTCKTHRRRLQRPFALRRSSQSNRTVCTATIKLVQQNHQKLETSNVCVKLLLFFFRPPPHSPLILSFISLFLLLGITEFCYAFLACVRTLLCFLESIPSESAVGSVRACACLRVSALGCACLYLQWYGVLFCLDRTPLR